MLSIGLTGGIAAGKSLLSTRFRELGAVVVDADLLAREVVAPGTPGLAAVSAEFGPAVLTADGALDRPALGALVFADKTRLTALNAIVHPLVRDAAARLVASAAPDAVVVQDIPLLVETGQGADFHLVVVVDAPQQQRLARMVEDRGMTPADAQARMAAQAGDAQRRTVADVVIDNSGAPAAAIAALNILWEDRLLPFASNLAAGVPAEQVGPPCIANADPAWPEQASRLAARIAKAAGGAAVDHIGSTSVPGLGARDVIDLQLRVRTLAEADAVAPALAAAGFPRSTGLRREERLHHAADPARPVNLDIRVDGSPGAVQALALRDWLRDDEDARNRYEAFKRQLAAEHAGDISTESYDDAKEAWITSAVPLVAAWLHRA